MRQWETYLSADEILQVKKFAGRNETYTKPALIVVDMYKKAFEENRDALSRDGSPSQSLRRNGISALPSIKSIIESFRRHNLPIAYTTGCSELEGHLGSATKRPRNAIDEEPMGYEICEAITPQKGELVVRKPMASAFSCTPLTIWLTQRDVRTLIVIGESTSGCVRATVVDGFSHGYEVYVGEDAVFDRIAVSHAVSLMDMHMKYGHVAPVAELWEHIASYLLAAKL